MPRVALVRLVPSWVWGLVLGLVAGMVLSRIGTPDVRHLHRSLTAAQQEVSVARTTLARTRDTADSLAAVLARADRARDSITAPIRGGGAMGVRPIVRRSAAGVDTLSPRLPALPASSDVPLELEEAAAALPIVLAALDSVTVAAHAREAAAMAERAAAAYVIAQQDTVIATQAAVIRAHRRGWWRRAGAAAVWVATGVAAGVLLAR